MKTRKIAQGILALILILVAVFFIIPILYCVLTSVKTTQEILQEVTFFPHKLTAENFEYVFARGGKYLNYYWNSIVVTLVSVACTVVLASMAGYAFARLPYRGSNLLMTSILFVLTFPLAALLIPIYTMEYEIGILNSHIGLILPNIMVILPFSIFIMRSTFLGLPAELEESAEIDGCGVFRSWLSIMLPLAKNGLIIIIVSGFYNVWGEYTLAKTLATKEAAMPISVALTLLKGEDWNFGVLGAAITMSIIPPIAVFVTFQKQLVAGMVAGAVKG